MDGVVLSVSDASDEPLHSQLTRQLRAKILSGTLTDGQSLPSIRAMARAQRVSVITVQRAYDDLERDGLIHARRGKGFFVSRLSPKQKQNLAESRLENSLSRIAHQATADGLSRAQIRTLLDKVLAKGGKR